MRPIRTIVICLTAVFAFGAVAAASASAAELPEIMQCAKAKKEGKAYLGHYSSKKCEASSYHAEGGQKYELEPWNLPGKKGKAKAFKGKGGGANLEIIGIGGISCASSADTGIFTGPKTAGKILVTFKGCKFEAKECTNTGKNGEVKTNPLEALVGYLSGKGSEHPVIGVRLNPEGTESFLSAPGYITCGELYFRVSDEQANDHGVMGVIDQKVGNPVNKPSKELTLEFDESSGVQQYKSFEGAGEQDELLTQKSTVKGEFTGITYDESGESTLSTGKGEELQLKA
jgi:hypothetical protein